jgi:hypothetical protein
MIDINKEAEEYAISKALHISKCRIKKESIAHLGLYEGFIAGHNSKATQVKVLQAQINILYEFRDYVENSSIFNDRIFKLQEELEQYD